MVQIVIMKSFRNSSPASLRCCMHKILRSHGLKSWVSRNTTEVWSVYQLRAESQREGAGFVLRLHHSRDFPSITESTFIHHHHKTRFHCLQWKKTFNAWLSDTSEISALKLLSWATVMSNKQKTAPKISNHGSSSQI